MIGQSNGGQPHRDQSRVEPARVEPARVEHGEILSALADPTRRHLLDLLAERPRSASDLARHVDISRQAVAKHLTALEAVALVEGARSGREVLFDLRPAGLDPLSEWMSRTAGAWERRLDRIQDALAATPDAGAAPSDPAS